MKPCEHEPLEMVGKSVCVCYYCGCLYKIEPPARDVVDEFVASLKGTAR